MAMTLASCASSAGSWTWRLHGLIELPHHPEIHQADALAR